MSGSHPVQPVPGPLLLVQDVVFFVLLGLTHGPAAWAAWQVSALVPLPIAWVAVPVVYALMVVLLVVTLARVLPSVPPGRHAAKSSAFTRWGLQLVVARLVRIQPVALLIRYSNLLRFLLLRGMGSRVAFSSQLSGDANLLDYRPLSLGEGCVIGSEAMLSTHLVVRGELVCAPISVGRGTLISARSMLGPGVTVGEGVVVAFGAELGMNVTVGDGARIGFHSLVDNDVKVGAGAVLEPRSYVPRGTEIPAGQRWGGAPACPIRESAPSS